jgi:hypothetical protein
MISSRSLAPSSSESSKSATMKPAPSSGHPPQDWAASIAQADRHRVVQQSGSARQTHVMTSNSPQPGPLPTMQQAFVEAWFGTGRLGGNPAVSLPVQLDNPATSPRGPTRRRRLRFTPYERGFSESILKPLACRRKSTRHIRCGPESWHGLGRPTKMTPDIPKPQSPGVFLDEFPLFFAENVSETGRSLRAGPSIG